MRRTAQTLFVGMFVLLLATPTISAAFKNVQVSEAPPVFTLKDIDDKEWTSADLIGEGKGVTVMVFWATWSPRSSEILKDLEALRKDVGEDTFRIVTVNCEHQAISSADRAAIRSMSSSLSLSGPVLVDDGLVAFNDYGAVALPSTLVIDVDGKVTYSLSGYPTTLREDLTDQIRRAAGLPTATEQRVVLEYVPKNHALMYYNLGKRLLDKGQEEKAEEQLQKSIEKDPDFKKSRVALGLLYKKTGRPDLALAEFRRAKQIDPKDQEALYQVASVSLLSGQFEEASGLFGELHEEFPEREEFVLGAALAAKYLGREGDYTLLREKAANLFPAEARFAYEMGSVAESQKDLPVAAELYRRAVDAALKSKN